MSYMITAECINCGACEMDCPVRAIAPSNNQYVIDENLCIDCEGYFPVARCKLVCPVNACAPERIKYLAKAGTMAKKGARPVVFRNGGEPAGEMIPS